MEDFYFNFSQRGKRILVSNGYKYKMHRIPAREKKVMWRCVNNCSASVYLDMETETKIVERRGIHNHDPLPEHKLLRHFITNSLKMDSKLKNKTISQIFKEKLTGVPLNPTEKKLMQNTLWRHKKICREKQLYECPSFKGLEEEKSEMSEEQHENDVQDSEEPFDSYTKDASSVGSDDTGQYNVPQPVFVPVGIIKEEPLETVEETRFLNTYSGDLGLNLFSNEKSTEAIPNLNIPSVPASTMLSENLSHFGGENTQTEVITNPVLGKTLSQSKALTNPHISKNVTSEIGRVITGTDNDFTNLKNIVYKLEKISDSLALAAVTDQYEQFGKYLATLLRGIPNKKFLSLKQKFINDVISAKMALDESNNPSLATGNCTVSKPVNLSECGSVGLESHQRNAYQFPSPVKFSRNCDMDASFRQRNAPTCTSVMGSEISTVPPILPVPTSSTVFAPVLQEENVNTRTARSSSRTCNSHLKRPAISTPALKRMKKSPIEQFEDQSKHASMSTEDSCKIEIEEGTELQDFKPSILDVSTSDYYKIQHTGEISTVQGFGDTVVASEGISSKSSESVVDSSRDQLPHMTCDKCNLDCSSSIDLKRHFMVEHPGDILSFKKTFSSVNLENRSEKHSHELLSTVEDNGGQRDLGNNKGASDNEQSSAEVDDSDNDPLFIPETSRNTDSLIDIKSESSLVFAEQRRGTAKAGESLDNRLTDTCQ